MRRSLIYVLALVILLGVNFVWWRSDERLRAADTATASSTPDSLFGVQASGAVTDHGLPANFRDERIAGGADLPAQFRLATPTAMAFLPDGRILVTEKGGKLRLVKDGLVQPVPALDWSAQTYQIGDNGMIGVAVDPNFATNGSIYLAYSSDNPREGRVSRFTMSGESVDPKSEDILLSTIVDHDSHVIDSVHFGPDGLLYASNGDSSPFDSATVYSTRSQQANQSVGKVYRMTSDGKGVANNPFWTGNPNDTASKVYGLGLRNPFRFTVRPDSTVIVGDVGWNTWEEVNTIHPNSGNHNYGWPCYEGANGVSQQQPAFSSYPICQTLLPKGTSAVTAPNFAYDHTVGSAVVGGPVYESNVFPAQYHGAYFFADYPKNWLDYWPMDAAGNFIGQPIRFANITNPVDLEMGPDGALYYISISLGQVRRVAYGAVTPCAQGNYLAQYYTNETWSGAPVITGCDDSINNDWGTGGPFGSSPVDHFSVSWSGKQYFTKGVNTLTSSSDDGMQVWVDGQLVIDNNGVHPVTTKTATLSSASGGFHTVLVKYYEAAGSAVAKLSITSVNKPPVPIIKTPGTGGRFDANQTLNVAGSATDPEDGAVSGTALQWGIILHHCPPVPAGATTICHTHPYDSFTGANGNFITPDTSGDWVWLEIDLTAVDSAGASATTQVNLYPNFCGEGQALGRYYTNQSWSGTPSISRCDSSINFNWMSGGPFGASPVDHFSIDWHMPRYFLAGTSTLTSTSDDGMLVFVDGQLVLNNGGIHAASPPKSATVNYASGGYHDVYVQYFENDGQASAKLAFTNPNGCPDNQLQGLYYTNQTWSGTPAITRCDAAVNFNWGLGGPFGASPGDHFSAQWHYSRYFPAGTSTLTSTSDDGMQVWVDGQLVLDNNGIHAATTKTATLTYQNAGFHDIKIKYYEAAGSAQAVFNAKP